MKLYAIRHGKTDWNVRRVMQGRVDVPLNDQGLAQAREAKENLRGYAFDRVFVSPQIRTMQTARIVTEGRNVPVIPEEALRERSYGVYEGKSRDDFCYEDFWNWEKDVSYENAESIRAFFGRVWPFLDSLKNRYPGEKILLVTHGGVIRAIECYAHPDMMNDQLGRWLPGNCSILEYDL